jgi:hypothetical protein
MALTFSLNVLKPVQSSGVGRKAAEPYRNRLSMTDVHQAVLGKLRDGKHSLRRQQIGRDKVAVV